MKNVLAVATVAALFGLGFVPNIASAAVTYTFAQTSGAGNLSSGVFGDNLHYGPRIQNPFTFGFTVASALAANTTYNFGAEGALGRGQRGDSGDVLDFRLSDGTPLSTFSLANYPTVREGYRGGPAAADTVRIHVATNATGAVSLYDIQIVGRSTVRPQDVLFFQLQHTAPNDGVGIVEAAYEYGGGSYRFVDGDIRCGLCTGTVTSAPGGIGGLGGAGGVPEPSSWALLITGFGMAGAVLRRRRDPVVLTA